MSRYKTEAQFFFDKIRHFYNHAGNAGYSQAEPYWLKLRDAAIRAGKSKNDKADVAEIRVMIESVEPWMDEMRIRKGD